MTEKDYYKYYFSNDGKTCNNCNGAIEVSKEWNGFCYSCRQGDRPFMNTGDLSRFGECTCDDNYDCFLCCKTCGTVCFDCGTKIEYKQPYYRPKESCCELCTTKRLGDDPSNNLVKYRSEYYSWKEIKWNLECNNCHHLEWSSYKVDDFICSKCPPSNPDIEYIYCGGRWKENKWKLFCFKCNRDMWFGEKRQNFLCSSCPPYSPTDQISLGEKYVYNQSSKWVIDKVRVKCKGGSHRFVNVKETHRRAKYSIKDKCVCSDCSRLISKVTIVTLD